MEIRYITDDGVMYLDIKYPIIPKRKRRDGISNTNLVGVEIVPYDYPVKLKHSIPPATSQC